MTRTKLLGFVLLALFVFGGALTATASAEEKEPAGLLYLPGEEGPVTIKGTGKEVILLTDGLLKVEIKCTEVKFEGEAGKGEGTHSTLGTGALEAKGCKLALGAKKVTCSSENIAGEKDPKEVVLFVKEDTAVHVVSLLNGKVLLAGVLIGLLELVKEVKKLDLTWNCGGVKVLILGAVFFPILKASPTAEVEKIEIAQNPEKNLTCDENDKLCKTELEKWAVKALLFNPETKKDETVLCPLGAFIETAEECKLIKISVPMAVTISKDVLIDF